MSPVPARAGTRLSAAFAYSQPQRVPCQCPCAPRHAVPRRTQVRWRPASLPLRFGRVARRGQLKPSQRQDLGVVGAAAPGASLDKAPAASALPLEARLGLGACALALCNGAALATAWLFRAQATVAALSAASLALCAPLCADVAWRAATPGAGSPLQLALDTACVVLVGVQAMEGLGYLVFTPSGALAAGVVRSVLPVACCAWVCRLGVASPLWAEHRAAAAAADAAVARAAAEGTARRLLDADATLDDGGVLWRGAAELLAARSGALWHLVTAALSLADWTLLGALWAAMEPTDAASTAAHVAAAAFLPALLALDGARLCTQLLHSAARGRIGTHAHPLTPLMPAGVPSRLAAGLLCMNVGCSVALLALAWHSPARWPLLPRAVLAARFMRLICECAYLVAGAALPVSLSTAPALALRDARDMGAACDAAAGTCAPMPLAPPLAPRQLQEEAEEEPWALRTLRSVVAEILPEQAQPQPAAAAVAAPPPPPKPAAQPRLGLDAFSSLALAGVRGYLRGEEAAEAVERVFSEADADSSGDVSAAEIGSWVAREPPDGGGVKWRASVRRVLLSLPAVAQQQQQQPPAPAVPSPPPSAAATTTAPVVTGPVSLPRYRPRGLRLLSLEGGGIKGLALIWQLQAIEKATGRPIHDLFDLIGGTSTGGILALALVNRIPLAQLELMWHDVARDVFARASLFRQLRHGHSADAAPLARILRDKLGADTPMRRPGADKPAAFVVATRTEMPPSGGGAARLELRLLRTYASAAPSGGRDGAEGWLQWEAALATSAAPTIFPPLRRADGATFVDGALSGNNNPSLLVLTEGLQLAAVAQQPVDIMVSLGCGEPPGGAAGAVSAAGEGPGVSTSGGAGSGLLFWLGQVVNLGFDASLQEERTVRLLGQVCPSARYARLSPSLRVDCALAEHRPEPLATLREDTQIYIAQRADELSRLAAWLAQDDVEDEAGGGMLPEVGQLSDALLL